MLTARLLYFIKKFILLSSIFYFGIIIGINTKHSSTEYLCFCITIGKYLLVSPTASYNLV
jgi:hypothetical protein